MKCKNCKFSHKSMGYFLLTGDSYDKYECRKQPPLTPLDGRGEWPRVRADDWCGEFKLRTV